MILTPLERKIVAACRPRKGDDADGNYDRLSARVHEVYPEIRRSWVVVHDLARIIRKLAARRRNRKGRKR